MSFLSKLGKAVANIAGIVSGVGPIFGASVPKAAGVISVITSDLQQIASVVELIESAAASASAPIPGAEKLKMATPAVAQAIVRSTLLAGKKIDNPTLFQQGAEKIASGMADVLNSLHEDAVKITQPQDS